jgi:putative nucleotidyltransferase with HDIG domain
MLRIEYLEICDTLKHIIEGTKYEGNIYVVGGAVRDYVMGNDINDIDIVVSLPNGGNEFSNYLFENCYLTNEPVIYPTYGTSMFKLKKYPNVEIEAVQTRKEQYNDKNQETEYGTLYEDAIHRDLTINALYYDVTNKIIIDVTNKGLDDISNKVIKVTSSPNIVFSDDPLRILRVISFASRYNWQIAKDTFDGMLANVNKLEIITKERIRDELNKMLLYDKPSVALEYIKEIGAMRYVIPELIETYELKQNVYHDFNTVWGHTLMTVDNSKPYLEVRVSALLHDIGKIKTKLVDDYGKVHFYGHEKESAKMSESILKRLKYSNDFTKTVKEMIYCHMLIKNWGDDLRYMKSKVLHRYEYWWGNNFYKILDLIDADNKSHGKMYCLPNQVDEILKAEKKYQENDESLIGYKLPVNGNDVMETLGMQPSIKVNECLQWLLKFAFNNPKITREELLKNLKHYKL